MPTRIQCNLFEKLGAFIKEKIPKDLDEIYIAVAYARYKGGIEILEEHLRKAKKIRIIVGAFGSTTPKALRKLYEICSEGDKEVRIIRDKDFHTKLYVFTFENKFIAIIGSSNLSKGGFERNIEINTILYGFTRYKTYRKLMKIFNEIWKRGKKLEKEFIEGYKKEYEKYREKRKGTKKSIIESIKRELNEGKARIWLLITSIENYKKCLKEKLWGVKIPPEVKDNRYLNLIKRIEKEDKTDYLVFYIKKSKNKKEGMKITGIFKRVSTPFEDKRKIWDDGIYAYRFKIKLITKKVYERPFNKDIIKKLKLNKIKCVQSLQGSMKELPKEDGIKLLEYLVLGKI